MAGTNNGQVGSGRAPLPGATGRPDIHDARWQWLPLPDSRYRVFAHDSATSYRRAHAAFPVADAAVRAVAPFAHLAMGLAVLESTDAEPPLDELARLGASTLIGSAADGTPEVMIAIDPWQPEEDIAVAGYHEGLHALYFTGRITEGEWTHVIEAIERCGLFGAEQSWVRQNYPVARWTAELPAFVFQNAGRFLDGPAHDLAARIESGFRAERSGAAGDAGGRGVRPCLPRA